MSLPKTSEAKCNFTTELGRVERPILRSRRLFSKAEEAVPWRIPELKNLSLAAIGMLYILSHGPRSGRCQSAATVGICLATPEELSALAGTPMVDVESSLAELVEAGWASVNRDHGVIIVYPCIQPADNAKHLHGIITAVAEKMPDIPETREYMGIVSERTREASKLWKSDRDAVDGLIRDMHRIFPELADDSIF
jgi:hypothetical protein